LNFTESIFRDNDLDGEYDDWNPYNQDDYGNIREPHPRKFLWTWYLDITCWSPWFWPWRYKIEHIIFAELDYSVKKYQSPILYTYFTCK